MTLASRLTRAPIPFDAEAGAEARRSFADLGPELADLLAGTAGCSPFLRGLMQAEAAWLRAALAQPPEAALADLLAALPQAGPAEALGSALRRAKRRAALLIALADLGGAWPLEQVTAALTQLADVAVDRAFRAQVAEEIRRARLPGQTADDLPACAGLVVLAMGKMGAGELNYSSDIDLVVLFDDDRYGAEAAEARAALIRATRRAAALVSDATAEGYVFRTDLRLRPDAAVTPVCLSVGAALQYYESEGRTWERAAYIKARPCAGDIAAGERFLAALTPFVWRRHLDFAAIRDAHDMRLRIRDHRGLHGPVTVEGHDVKLGQGGIREIEFFTQTRQLIAGGRDPSLRDRTTAGGLAALARAGWIPPDVARGLTEDYRAHREVEHRLQMVQDAQTHAMPVTAQGVARIAAFCGMTEAAFRRNFLDRLDRVERLTNDFFRPDTTAVQDLPALSPAAAAIVARWDGYAAFRSDRARASFGRIRPAFLRGLARAANPDEALVALDGFLAGLPAGVQLFALFEANPQLVDLICDIAGTSPLLARHLSRNSGVLEAVIGGSFFDPWPGVAALTADLAQAIATETDYERRLDALRRRMREWHFRVGVHHLRGLIGAEEAGKSYADLAEATVAALWPLVAGDFARRHGPPPGRGACVLGMGSLGAGRLNAGSDLDLIVIYDAAGQEESAGPRPLAARPYYARLTQALVTALTAQMPAGRLYEVDMRLRPSGRQGPVATSIQSFASYQRTEAWTWEHLALTRARPVAGSAELGAEVESFRLDLLAEKAGGDRVLADVAEMRARLQTAKPAQGPWDARNGPGRLMDIELMAQTAALRAADPGRTLARQLRAGERSGLLTAEEAGVLRDTAGLMWSLHAAARLLSDRPLDPAALGEGGRALILRETDAPDAAALTDRVRAASARAAAIVAAKLGGG
ncbi:MAG: glutamine-synthetase adenylyltransferase [Rhodobacterales bacterium]|nr:glutamine-synthetase adenylyltransferase [Rhodobacterales bacterium]